MGEKMKNLRLRSGNRIPLRAETVFPQDSTFTFRWQVWLEAQAGRRQTYEGES